MQGQESPSRPSGRARIPRGRIEELCATWRPRTTLGFASFRRSYKGRGGLFEKLEIKLPVAAVFCGVSCSRVLGVLCRVKKGF